MTRARVNRVCSRSGTSLGGNTWTTGKVECPRCRRWIYMTMRGKLYKHTEKEAAR